MPQLDWNLILASLLYAALTGVFNLALGHKSQVEAWATANPKLAALLKVTRALGLDPWNLFSAALLLLKGKLPAAQQANSQIARVEKLKAEASKSPDDTVNFGPPVLILLLAGLVLSQQACASWKPIARTADGIAETLCAQFFGEKQKLSLEDASRRFCATREDLAPWIDQILAAKRAAGAKASLRHP